MSMEKAKQYCIQNAKEELSILEGADFSQPIPTDMLCKILFHTRLADINGVLERLVKEIHPDARIRSYYQFNNHIRLADMNGDLERLVKESHTDTQIRDDYHFNNQVVIDVPLDNEYVTLRLEEYQGQPQISVIDDYWFVQKPESINKYLLDNKNEREQFFEQYMALLELNASWLEKARVRCLKKGKKSVLYLFFWWFFVIKPKDRCNKEYCKACIDSEISIHIGTYNSNIKRYNESVRLSQSVVYRLVPLLEEKCSRVIVADGIRQQAKETFLSLV